MPENVPVDVPVIDQFAVQVQQRDTRIAELEALLKEQTDKHSYQTKRADDLEKRLKVAAAAVRKYETARAAEAEATASDRVVLDGQEHRIIGAFRADSTFVEVKRGHCPEGVTLVAIDKTH